MLNPTDHRDAKGGRAPIIPGPQEKETPPSMKDFDELRRQATAQGWRIEPTRSGHLRWVPPPGTAPGHVTSASTPSDWRAIRNITARLKQKGLHLPGSASHPLDRGPCKDIGVTDQNSTGMTTPHPACERPASDVRPGVMVQSKVCPDCACADGAQHDPRAGLRPSTDFNGHARTKDGLAPYCRTHMSARMVGKHKSTGARVPSSPSPKTIHPDATGDGPDGHSAPDVRTHHAAQAPSPSSSQEQDPSSSTPPHTTPPDTPDVSTIEMLFSAMAALEKRVQDLEDQRKDQELDTGAALTRLDTRLSALEAAEHALPPQAQADPSHARSLRRWLKGVARDQARQQAQIDRTAAQADEAVRLAQTAARLSTPRPDTPALDALLPQLEARIKTDVQKSVEGIVDSKMRHLIGKQTKDVPPPAPDTSRQNPTPKGMQEEVLLILAHYGNNIKNLMRVEHEGLMEKTDIEHVLGRITGRAVQDMCALIMRYQQPIDHATGEKKNE